MRPLPTVGPGTGFLSGGGGYVKIGTVNYCFDRWKLSMKNTLVEVTSFCSGGFQVMIPGISSATLTVSGPYDSANMPFSIGQSYAWILGFSATLSITLSAFIETLEPDVDVKGRASLAITAQSSGSFAGAVTFEAPGASAPERHNAEKAA